MRLPLVVIPQHFGSLVFDRRTSRYAPFDHATTRLLVGAIDRPIDEWASSAGRTATTSELAAARVAQQGSPTSLRHDEVADFVAAFTRAGYFRPDGRLAGSLLPVDAAELPRDHLLGPLAVHVEVVAACNLTCTHCFAGELPRKTSLTTPELDRVFGELAQLGSYRIGLTGGEPLLRKDLLDVIDSATSRGLHPCLTTNGTLLDEAMARELGKRELVWVNISLEGARAASNDLVRGAGVFDEVVAKLRAFGRHFRFTLAFTITKHNANEVDACAALAKELGAHTAVFRPVYPVGVARDHPELAPSYDDYARALATLSSCRSPDAEARPLDAFAPALRVESQAVTYSGPGCGAANLVASINASGEVNPCSFLGSSFESGNVRDRGFRTIWNAGHAFRRLREHREGDTFRGGCRARALAAHGDAHARDPWHDAWLGEPSRPAPLANLHVKRLPVIV